MLLKKNLKFKNLMSFEALLWCMKPSIELVDLIKPLPKKVMGLASYERSFKLPKILVRNNVFSMTHTTNQERAISPYFNDLSDEILYELPSTDRRKDILTGEAVIRVEDHLRNLLLNRAEKPVIESLVNTLYRIAVLLDSLKTLELERYELAVISTQHSPLIRMFLLLAKKKGLKTLYVPHAPVASNLAYADLPADFVALRGINELKYYQDKLGISTKNCFIVGNLSTDVINKKMSTIDPKMPPVLGLSPHKFEILKQIFDIFKDSKVETLTLAPHPASNPNQIRELIPDGVDWELVSNVRTIDLLTQGAPCLFHFSSGLALEAATLGIPTANILLPGFEINYPFLKSNSLSHSVSTPEEIVEFIKKFQYLDIDTRQAIKSDAIGWIAADGDNALNSLTEIIAGITSRNKTSWRIQKSKWVYDGWADKGYAELNSWWNKEIVGNK